MVRLEDEVGTLNFTYTSFQFHYGTIRSMILFLFAFTRTYFNSTMVRLEVSSASLAASSCSYFNSTMVRLEVSRFLLKSRPILFQFHYGTIRSSFSCSEEEASLDFNSTMVRLEVSAIMHRLRRFWYFNSTMVRLEV